MQPEETSVTYFEGVNEVQHICTNNIRATEHCFETMVLFTDSTSTIPAQYHIITLVYILPVTHTTDQKNIQLCISSGYIPYTVPFTPFQWI